MITLQASFERIMKSLPLCRSHAEGAKGPHAEDAGERSGEEDSPQRHRAVERLD